MNSKITRDPPPRNLLINFRRMSSMCKDNSWLLCLGNCATYQFFGWCQIHKILNISRDPPSEIYHCWTFWTLLFLVTDKIFKFAARKDTTWDSLGWCQIVDIFQNGRDPPPHICDVIFSRAFSNWTTCGLKSVFWKNKMLHAIYLGPRPSGTKTKMAKCPGPLPILQKHKCFLCSPCHVHEQQSSTLNKGTTSNSLERWRVGKILTNCGDPPSKNKYNELYLWPCFARLGQNHLKDSLRVFLGRCHLDKTCKIVIDPPSSPRPSGATRNDIIRNKQELAEMILLPRSNYDYCTQRYSDRAELNCTMSDIGCIVEMK